MNQTKILLFLLLWSGGVFGQTTFSSLEELLAFSEKTNIDLVTNQLRLASAEKLEKTAALGVLNPKINLPMTYTNNTTVPANLFPAEIVGGAPGTFTEIQMGVQYTANLSQTLDVQLYNPVGWSERNLAKINTQLTQNNNQITRQQLQQSVADSYFNIRNLQKQLETTAENLTVVDSLLQLTNNKYEAGLIRQQDVNNAEINRLNTLQNQRQIEQTLSDAYLTLKILCDIPTEENIEILATEKQPTAELEKRSATVNQLALKNSLLQQEYAAESLEKAKKTFLPTVSFVAGNTFQANSNDAFVFDDNWITSNYIGLKVGINLPTTQTVTGKEQAELEQLVAIKELEKTKISLGLEAERLNNHLKQANRQVEIAKKILNLTTENYQKNLNLYQEGIVGIDLVLDDYNALVNAAYSLNTALSEVELAAAKIKINNDYN